MKKWNLAWILAILMVLTLSTWIYFLITTKIVLEDALITYRYAENIALGRGFVFNIGEKVLGTTTPLLTLLLASFGYLFGVNHIPLISNILMMTAGLGAGFFIYQTLKRFDLPLFFCFLGTILFYFHFDTLWMVTGGMETPLVYLFMSLSLFSFMSKKASLGGIACALLVLTRIDGLLWSLLLFCLFLLKKDKPIRFVISFSLLLFPWIVFAFWYFGSPFPYSAIAKKSIGLSKEYPFYSIFMLKEYYKWVNEPTFQSLLFPLWPVFVFLGVSHLFNRKFRFLGLVLVSFPLLFVGSLFVGKAPPAPTFKWYFAPIIFCVLLLGILGLAELWKLTKERTPDLSKSLMILLSGLLIGSLFYNGRNEVLFHIKNQMVHEGAFGTIGHWLRENSPENATVLTEAIGFQGYYSGRRIIDLAGLISPEVVKFRQESSSNAETFYKILTQLKPDYIVLRSFEVTYNQHFHGGKLFDDEVQKKYFMDNYKDVKDITAPFPEMYGPLSYLTIYEKVSPSMPPNEN